MRPAVHMSRFSIAPRERESASIATSWAGGRFPYSGFFLFLGSENMSKMFLCPYDRTLCRENATCWRQQDLSVHCGHMANLKTAFSKAKAPSRLKIVKSKTLSMLLPFARRGV